MFDNNFKLNSPFLNLNDSSHTPVSEGRKRCIEGKVSMIESTPSLESVSVRVDVVARDELQQLQNTLEDDEDLFGNHEIELDYQQKEKTIIKANNKRTEGSLETDAGSLQKELLIEPVSIKDTALERLRNRKQTTDKVEGLIRRFGGDVAWGILERKEGDKTIYHNIANERVNQVLKVLEKHELNGADRKDLELCMLGKLALVLNADADRKLYWPDIDKAYEKADELLQSQLKDKNGEPISDDEFRLIKEEIKNEFLLQLVYMGIIKKSDLEKLKKEEIKNKNIKERIHKEIVVLINHVFFKHVSIEQKPATAA